MRARGPLPSFRTSKRKRVARNLWQRMYIGGGVIVLILIIIVVVLLMRR
jgi:hypothetical protein